jgi:hypothetical protein
MEKNRFKEALLGNKEFIYTLELVPGRGSRGKTQDEILRLAEKAAKSRLFHALSITDNPGGHPALFPDVIGLEIARLGIDPLIHFTCTEAPFYKSLRWFSKRIDGTRLEGLFTEMEYWIKFISSRCRRCGDCTLLEVAFLCPQSQCPKYLFNGQCGGSSEGWCEVFPGKKRCIYVRAYDRLKPYGEEESLKIGYTPPRNWALDQTSSWANYFLGRDHHGKK